MSFSVSANNAYINTGYAFRTASESQFRAPVLLTSSRFPFNFDPVSPSLPGPDIQRFGDNSAVVVDPCDGTTFWLTQPWAALNNAWGIQTTQLLD